MGRKKGYQKPVLGGARSSGPSRAKNGWNEFQALHRGKGLSQGEMRQLYKDYKEGICTMPEPGNHPQEHTVQPNVLGGALSTFKTDPAPPSPQPANGRLGVNARAAVNPHSAAPTGGPAAAQLSCEAMLMTAPSVHEQSPVRLARVVDLGITARTIAAGAGAARAAEEASEADVCSNQPSPLLLFRTCVPSELDGGVTPQAVNAPRMHAPGDLPAPPPAPPASAVTTSGHFTPGLQRVSTGAPDAVNALVLLPCTSVPAAAHPPAHPGAALVPTCAGDGQEEPQALERQALQVAAPVPAAAEPGGRVSQWAGRLARLLRPGPRGGRGEAKSRAEPAPTPAEMSAGGCGQGCVVAGCSAGGCLGPAGVDAAGGPHVCSGTGMLHGVRAPGGPTGKGTDSGEEEDTIASSPPRRSARPVLDNQSTHGATGSIVAAGWVHGAMRGAFRWALPGGTPCPRRLEGGGPSAARAQGSSKWQLHAGALGHGGCCAGDTHGEVVLGGSCGTPHCRMALAMEEAVAAVAAEEVTHWRGRQTPDSSGVGATELRGVQLPPAASGSPCSPGLRRLASPTVPCSPDGGWDGGSPWERGATLGALSPATLYSQGRGPGDEEHEEFATPAGSEALSCTPGQCVPLPAAPASGPDAAALSTPSSTARLVLRPLSPLPNSPHCTSTPSRVPPGRLWQGPSSSSGVVRPPAGPPHVAVASLADKQHCAGSPVPCCPAPAAPAVLSPPAPGAHTLQQQVSPFRLRLLPPNPTAPLQHNSGTAALAPCDVSPRPYRGGDLSSPDTDIPPVPPPRPGFEPDARLPSPPELFPAPRPRAPTGRPPGPRQRLMDSYLQPPAQPLARGGDTAGAAAPPVAVVAAGGGRLPAGPQSVEPRAREQGQQVKEEAAAVGERAVTHTRRRRGRGKAVPVLAYAGRLQGGVGPEAGEGVGAGPRGGGDAVPSWYMLTRGAGGGVAAEGCSWESRLRPRAAGDQGVQQHVPRGAAPSVPVKALPGRGGQGSGPAARTAADGLRTAAAGGDGLHSAHQPEVGHVAKRALHPRAAATAGLAAATIAAPAGPDAPRLAERDGGDGGLPYPPAPAASGTVHGVPWGCVLAAGEGRRLRETDVPHDDELLSGFGPWREVVPSRLGPVRPPPGLVGVYEWGCRAPDGSRVIAFYLGKAGGGRSRETLRTRFSRYAASTRPLVGPVAERRKMALFAELQRRGFSLHYRYSVCTPAHGDEAARRSDRLAARAAAGRGPQQQQHNQYPEPHRVRDTPAAQAPPTARPHHLPARGLPSSLPPCLPPGAPLGDPLEVERQLHAAISYAACKVNNGPYRDLVLEFNRRLADYPPLDS